VSVGFQGHSGKLFASYHQLNFNEVEAVVVSGDSPNFCGHMILRVDNYYFHVSGVFNYPMFLSNTEFDRYLRENNKTEVFRVKRKIFNPRSARSKLKSLLSKKWLWLILPNNCTDFVEEVIGAGENDINLISNCPTMLKIKIQQEIILKKMTLTRRGRRLLK